MSDYNYGLFSLIEYNKKPIACHGCAGSTSANDHRRSLTLSSVLSLSFFPIPIMFFRTLLDDRLSIGFMLTPLRLLFNMPPPPDGVLGFSLSSFFLPNPSPPNGEVDAEPLLFKVGELDECGVGEVDACC